MDGPELLPALRRRSRFDTAEPPAPAAATPPAAAATTTEVNARLSAIESTLRTVEVRLEAFERQGRTATEGLRAAVDSGFQEMSSRALVLAEATDEILTRHAEALDRLESMVGALPREIPVPEVDLAEVIGAVERVERSIDVAGLAAAIEAVTADLETVRSDVSLVANRISTLLGGPSLTEILDRIDELEERLDDGGARKRRKQ